ncbi:DUF4946 domain-containing protein [Pseudomonas fluorescens]|uniref:DUF4946 domain-containing protein n=1 Tax=Pseudomonas fluorescens TaxID=294 RepID=A0A5E7AH29_PSEFL|nr:DUF4946 domain-containing protein [Pseudomonas fluorescens]VVN77290.1 hypothetical protein PS833_00820 [Pseudomonas fluorescens]VVQ08948.1 hypothetical protein PS914_04932 [Pseudomonas fluorescens]
MIRFCPSMFVLLSVFWAATTAHADAPVVTWPAGWQVEAVPQDPANAQVSRQRAVKTDQGGTPVMVMELTMTQVQSGHQVNLQGVLLEMRKSVQKDFFQGGYQSVCNKIHPTRLSRLEALETTCTITQNGRHVLSQTLVAAVDADKAYVFSSAGQADAYKASQGEIDAARNSLKL